MPKISIIVPVYKVEKYLCRCIDSILNQSFTDFECILVDDGSPDNCGKICDEYGKKDDRVIVIHKENGGLSDARNAGIDVATGRYFYFCDSDDYIENNLLETVVNAMECGNYGSVSFGYFREDEDGDIKHTFQLNPKEYHWNTEKECLNFICNELMSHKSGWEACMHLYNGDTIKNANLRFFNNQDIFAEDLFFLLCYLLETSNILVMENVLYHYVIRGNSITMGRTGTKLNEFINLSIQLFGVIRNKGLKYLKKNYYMLFCAIMNNCFSQSNHMDIINDIKKAKNKEFLCKYLFRVLVRSKKISDQISWIDRRTLIEDYKQYLEYSYNEKVFHLIKKTKYILRKIIR